MLKLNRCGGGLVGSTSVSPKSTLLCDNNAVAVFRLLSIVICIHAAPLSSWNRKSVCGSPCAWVGPLSLPLPPTPLLIRISSTQSNLLSICQSRQTLSCIPAMPLSPDFSPCQEDSHRFSLSVARTWRLMRDASPVEGADSAAHASAVELIRNQPILIPGLSILLVSSSCQVIWSLNTVVSQTMLALVSVRMPTVPLLFS